MANQYENNIDTDSTLYCLPKLTSKVCFHEANEDEEQDEDEDNGSLEFVNERYQVQNREKPQESEDDNNSVEFIGKRCLVQDEEDEQEEYSLGEIMDEQFLEFNENEQSDQDDKVSLETERYQWLGEEENEQQDEDEEAGEDKKQHENEEVERDKNGGSSEFEDELYQEQNEKEEVREMSQIVRQHKENNDEQWLENNSEQDDCNEYIEDISEEEEQTSTDSEVEAELSQYTELRLAGLHFVELRNIINDLLPEFPSIPNFFDIKRVYWRLAVLIRFFNHYFDVMEQWPGLPTMPRIPCNFKRIGNAKVRDLHSYFKTWLNHFYDCNNVIKALKLKNIENRGVLVLLVLSLFRRLQRSLPRLRPVIDRHWDHLTYFESLVEPLMRAHLLLDIVSIQLENERIESQLTRYRLEKAEMCFANVMKELNETKIKLAKYKQELTVKRAESYFSSLTNVCRKPNVKRINESESQSSQLNNENNDKDADEKEEENFKSKKDVSNSYENENVSSEEENSSDKVDEESSCDEKKEGRIKPRQPADALIQASSFRTLSMEKGNAPILRVHRSMSSLVQDKRICTKRPSTSKIVYSGQLRSINTLTPSKRMRLSLLSSPTENENYVVPPLQRSNIHEHMPQRPILVTTPHQIPSTSHKSTNFELTKPCIGIKLSHRVTPPQKKSLIIQSRLNSNVSQGRKTKQKKLDFSFMTSANLKAFCIVRDDKWSCKYCPRQFIKEVDFKNHLEKEHQSKVVMCDWVGCNRFFVNNYKMSRHERTHTGEKPYSCRYCSQRFARSDKLNEHLKAIHPTSQPAPGITTRVVGNQHASSYLYNAGLISNPEGHFRNLVDRVKDIYEGQTEKEQPTTSKAVTSTNSSPVTTLLLIK